MEVEQVEDEDLHLGFSRQGVRGGPGHWSGHGYRFPVLTVIRPKASGILEVSHKTGTL